MSRKQEIKVKMKMPRVEKAEGQGRKWCLPVTFPCISVLYCLESQIDGNKMNLLMLQGQAVLKGP